jgi:multiple sugar transport system substrate-binding protein
VENLVTKVEVSIAVLVLIAIIVSGVALGYSLSILGKLDELTRNMADLTTSMIDLTEAMTDIADKIGASLDTINTIQSRLTEVEGRLTPTITVIGPWSGPEMDKFLPVLARFEALTGINVRYKVYRAEELATLLPAQFAAGTAPGDVIFMWGWFIAENAENGHVMEVTDLIDESKFLSGSLDAVKVNDKLYGCAYTGKVKPGFWYKKSFFTANGLTEPKTWSEFLTLLDTLKTLGFEHPIASGDEIGWPLSDITEHFLITFGGPELQLQLINGTASWTQDPVRGIFEDYLVPLLDAGYFSEPIEWTTALDQWWQGDYALYFMGSWITGMVDDPSDLGVFSLPGCEGLVFAADYFFIPKYTPYPDEAKELFKFLASSEAQRLQVAQGGHIATNIEVSLDSYPEVDRIVANLTVGKAVLPDLDDSIGGEFQATFWDQLKLLWVSPQSLDEVLQNIEAVAP